jgi:hypothetical protein
MVVIVVIMSVIVFVFYTGVFGALLGSTRLYPENFNIVAAGAPSSGGFNASAIQPTGNNPNSFPGGLTSCTGTITGTAGNLLVPPGASCTINGATVQSIYVNYGASLTMSGANAQGVYDNRSASITITSNTKISGNIGLYGTQSFSVTNSQQTSGNLVMNGVVYATFSNTALGRNLQATSCGSVQVDSNTINGNVAFVNDQVVRLTNNTINGNVAFVNDQVVRLTNNTIHGTLTFTTDPNCYAANNVVSGTTTGTCTGGSPSGNLDIFNTGSYTVRFNTLYLDGQPWSGISWQLATGSTEQCGNTVIPIGPCTVFPIVIPPNTLVHLSFSWVNPTPTSPLTILMFTIVSNYLESRVDPTAGLVCSTGSIYPPRDAIGFC